MEYTSIRLNLSQAFNGIGKVVGPLIASNTFFRSGNEDNLSAVQWAHTPIL
jgi:MFS transporter, FHS family, L-fucose permease